MIHRRHVLVLVPQELGYAREVVRGVREYSVIQGGWTLRSGTLPRPDQLHDILAGDGIVGFYADEAVMAAAAQLGVPSVNVSARLPACPLPRVIADNNQAGRLAAEHLLGKGFRQFGFVCVGDHYYSCQRRDGFTAVLGEQGLGDRLSVAPHGEMGDWLAHLPTPVGILAATDAMAQQLVDLAIARGLHVPEQVAVMGVDNDEFLCQSSAVDLTSVDSRGREVGLRAAELLDTLMSGSPAPEEPILVSCGPVVARRSTDTFGSVDENVAFAIRYIRAHACERMRIDQILEHLSISRRTLEMRFRRAFGRSLHDEIRRQQIERARQLLRETDLPIGEVAWRSGFCDRIQFGRIFSAETGTSPTGYRQTAAMAFRRPPL